MPVTLGSPPKRMTRARAKAVEEKQKTTKITTPAAKAAAEAAKTAKGKARSQGASIAKAGDAKAVEDDKAEDVVDPQLGAEAQRGAPAEPGSMKNVPKKKVDQASQPPATAAPKPRGRPRKNTVTENAEVVDNVTAAPPARSTKAKTTVTTRAAPSSRSATVKKQVTFQDGGENDKENVDTGAAKGSAGRKPVKPAGKAPVRAPPARSTRAAKAAEGSKRQTHTKPLSPKKPQQVAKGLGEAQQKLDSGKSKVCAEAEPKLATEAAPRNLDAELHAKPLDTASSTKQSPSNDGNPSPSKPQGQAAMGSSPRRLPLSPFKDSMKTSPRKFVMTDKTAPASGPSVAPQVSQLLKSPMKMRLSPKKESTVSSPHVASGGGASLCQASPRRLPSPIKSSVKQDARAPEPSKFNVSLLCSPAKRPTSPIKLSTSASPGKTPAARTFTALASTPTLQKSPIRNTHCSPSRNLMTSFKAVESSAVSSKSTVPAPLEAHTTFDDELAHGAVPTATEDIGVDVAENPSPKESKSMPNSQPTPSREKDETTATSALHSLQPKDNVSATASVITRLGASNPSGQADLQGRSSATPMDVDDDSEDELQSADPRHDTSPKRRSLHGVQTPLPNRPADTTKSASRDVSMTVLAERFGAWTGASPDKDVVEKRKGDRSMFSPLKRTSPSLEDEDDPLSSTPLYTGTPCQLQGYIDIREDGDEAMPDATTPSDFFRQSLVSEASQVYGDENVIPIDPALLEPESAAPATCTPSRIFRSQPHVVHTVSKVPLKEEACSESSPLDRPRVKRSRSMSSALTPRADLELQALRQIHPREIASQGLPQLAPQPRYNSKFTESLHDGWSISAETAPHTPASKADKLLASATPARTPRPDLDNELLSGVVAYTDVHTTEGADASGIFVDLLTQMGARCVKQWNWSPLATSGDDEANLSKEDTPPSRVGITHVIFKDGGKRTMEKVREANGLVSCVGVGWVLDCEHENKWLDESAYALDISTIPRGGHRRRKSMEPRTLANYNGTLSAANSPHKLSPPDMSPTKEFLNLSPDNRRVTMSETPALDRRVSFAPNDQTFAAPDPLPFTPMKDDDVLAGDFSDSPMGGSPATPYFLHPQQLVQQTCPPKQTRELLFPLSGRIADQPNSAIKQRLHVARRKSLQFAPKVGSPLSRGF
ncbi:MAG: hypothetical protein M1828_001385 [Chrysothrix sp. TS-e1954]|nr:MAG: hypothetical protein M1828_001385 [Chrysothrix sp. TS-e1954]